MRLTMALASISMMAVLTATGFTVEATPPSAIHPVGKQLHTSLGKFREVHMFSPLIGMGITRGGLIEHTVNGGKTWMISYAGPHLPNVVSFVDSVPGAAIAWVVGIGSGGRAKLLMTPNGGFSYHTRSLPRGIEAKNVVFVRFTSVDVGWMLVGSRDSTVLYKTTDNGWKWTVIN